jgi:hypothetical protein
MTNSQAILIGASLIVAGMLFGQGIRSAQAQQGGPYQLMHHSNTVANAGVFRLDTSSGGVSYCFIADANGSSIVCSREVK